MPTVRMMSTNINYQKQLDELVAKIAETGLERLSKNEFGYDELFSAGVGSAEILKAFLDEQLKGQNLTQEQKDYIRRYFSQGGFNQKIKDLQAEIAEKQRLIDRANSSLEGKK